MTIYFLIQGLLTFAFIVVIITDISTYRIPNWLNLGLLIGWPLYLILYSLILAGFPGWEFVLWHVGMFFAVFAGAFALYAVGAMGGGDVKLLAVCAMWTGKLSTLGFLLNTAIYGGILAIIILLLRTRSMPLWAKFGKGKPLPRVLTAKQPVPYGVAIAVAMLQLIWQGRIPLVPGF